MKPLFDINIVNDKNLCPKTLGFECESCAKTFNADAKSVRYALKNKYLTYFRFCTRECDRKFKHNASNIKCNCDACGKEFQKFKSELAKNNYCSRKCSAKFRNQVRKQNGYTSKGKHKNVLCKDCGTDVLVKVNCSSTALCLHCEEKYKPVKQYKPVKLKRQTLLWKTVNCFRCAKSIIVKGGRMCASCCGKLSAETQSENRRSKNEIHFYELCKACFGCDHVFANRSMFGGWDADIIIPHLKMAVLWNGVWHYKKITAKHSVQQVQNRDRLKRNAILRSGYFPYVIKDMGKENKTLVKLEFEKFKTWLFTTRTHV